MLKLRLEDGVIDEHFNLVDIDPSEIIHYLCLSSSKQLDIG